MFFYQFDIDSVINILINLFHLQSDYLDFCTQRCTSGQTDCQNIHAIMPGVALMWLIWE